MPREGSQFLVDHVEFVDDLQRGGGVVQRGAQGLERGLRVARRVAFMALSAPTEAVGRAPAVDIAEERPEPVRQPDVGELVQGSDHDRRQVAVDLGVHDDDRQDLAAPLVAAHVFQSESLRVRCRDVDRPFAAVRAVVHKPVRVPLLLARLEAVEHPVGCERVGRVAATGVEADEEGPPRVAADLPEQIGAPLADGVRSGDHVELPLCLLERQQPEREAAPGGDSDLLASGPVVEHAHQHQAEVRLGLAAAGGVPDDGCRLGRIHALVVTPEPWGEVVLWVLPPRQGTELADDGHQLEQAPSPARPLPALVELHHGLVRELEGRQQAPVPSQPRDAVAKAGDLQRGGLSVGFLAACQFRSVLEIRRTPGGGLQIRLHLVGEVVQNREWVGGEHRVSPAFVGPGHGAVGVVLWNRHTAHCDELALVPSGLHPAVVRVRTELTGVAVGVGTEVHHDGQEVVAFDLQPGAEQRVVPRLVATGTAGVASAPLNGHDGVVRKVLQRHGHPQPPGRHGP